MTVEEMLALGGSILSMAGVVGHFFVTKYKVEQNRDNIIDIWRWKNSHEKESTNLREKYQTQLSELKGGQLVVNEQFRQIMMMLEEIKQRITELENHKNGRN